MGSRARFCVEGRNEADGGEVRVPMDREGGVGWVPYPRAVV